MSPAITRRALLGATAAVGAIGLPVAASALTALTPAPAPDASLVVLIARHGTALADSAASDLVYDVEMAIMDTAPLTLPGFRAKARWIAASKQPEDWAEALLRDLAGIDGVAS